MSLPYTSSVVELVLYVDGGCKGNAQFDISQRRMVALVTDVNGAVISERFTSGGSNNIAELLAVRDALLYARDNGIKVLEVRTDSRNNFSWVFGRKLGQRLNDRATVEELRSEIGALRQRVELKLVWVPRQQNRAGHYLEGKGL